MKLKIKELAVFAVLGAIMCASDVFMDIIPIQNIHLIGVFTVAITAVFRSKALLPLYTYILLIGAFFGFAPSWMPYLYIWLPLWAMAMLVPQRAPERLKTFLYVFVCAFHGLIFGILYAPSQALMFGLDFNGMLGWIIFGIPSDVIHCVSNALLGVLIYPIIKVLARVKREIYK